MSTMPAWSRPNTTRRCSVDVELYRWTIAWSAPLIDSKVRSIRCSRDWVRTWIDDVVGDQVVLDQHPDEVEVGLRGGREADLDLLVAHRDQQVEHPQLALGGHRVDEGLVAVAQVDGAPARGLGDDGARPGAVGQGDGRERLVAGEGHRRTAAGRCGPRRGRCDRTCRTCGAPRDLVWAGSQVGLVPANDESRDEEAGGLGLVAAAKEQRCRHDARQGSRCIGLHVADDYIDPGLAPGKYLSLTTFRADGTPVATPVWLVRDGDALLVMTDPASGKAKRLRSDSARPRRPLRHARAAHGRGRSRHGDRQLEDEGHGPRGRPDRRATACCGSGSSRGGARGAARAQGSGSGWT